MNVTNSVIDFYLTEHLDEYILETSELCAQPSISATGEGVAECADLVETMLQRRQFAVNKFATDGNPIIVAHASGQSPRTLLFYNHYDVQPPEPLELWTTPPFKPTVRKGALYARGAVDDKGELVARLAAVDAVRAANDDRLPCGVTFVVEGEEEIGSPHIAQFVQEHKELLASHGLHLGTGLCRRGRAAHQHARRARRPRRRTARRNHGRGRPLRRRAHVAQCSMAPRARAGRPEGAGRARTHPRLL